MNTRMGDSEYEVIFPRITNNLSTVFNVIAKEEIWEPPLQISNCFSVATRLVTGLCSGIDEPLKCWPNTMNFQPQHIYFNPQKLKARIYVY